MLLTVRWATWVGSRVPDSSRPSAASAAVRSARRSAASARRCSAMSRSTRSTQRDETQAGVRAGGGAEAEEYHRRDHRALAHPRQMLQEDLEEGGEGGGEEDEPALQRERGQDDEQDVDTRR